MKKWFAFILVGFSLVAFADELDSASKEALDKTQTLLKSPADRQKYINEHPDAKAADKKLDDLSSDPQIKDSMYNTSSEIFADLVKQTGGDATKQKELLDQAAKNPEAFFNSLSPEQQAEIRGIAGKLQEKPPMDPKR